MGGKPLAWTPEQKNTVCPAPEPASSGGAGYNAACNGACTSVLPSRKKNLTSDAYGDYFSLYVVSQGGYYPI